MSYLANIASWKVWAFGALLLNSIAAIQKMTIWIQQAPPYHHAPDTPYIYLLVHAKRSVDPIVQEETIALVVKQILTDFWQSLTFQNLEFIQKFRKQQGYPSHNKSKGKPHAHNISIASAFFKNLASNWIVWRHSKVIICSKPARVQPFGCEYKYKLISVIETFGLSPMSRDFNSIKRSLCSMYIIWQRLLSGSAPNVYFIGIIV